MGFTLSNRVTWMHYREFTLRGANYPISTNRNCTKASCEKTHAKRSQLSLARVGLFRWNEAITDGALSPHTGQALDVQSWLHPATPFIKLGRTFFPKLLQGELSSSISIAASFNSKHNPRRPSAAKKAAPFICGSFCLSEVAHRLCLRLLLFYHHLLTGERPVDTSIPCAVHRGVLNRYL